MKVDGIDYKRNVGVVYDMTDDLPKVGQITSIYVINHNTVIFAVKCFSSICDRICEETKSRKNQKSS